MDIKKNKEKIKDETKDKVKSKANDETKDKVKSKAKDEKKDSAKENSREKSVKKNTVPKLPLNIMQLGERVLENKNIYIHQKVYDQIHKFAANKTENEHGGVLVGRVLNELGKENTIIEGFIEAKYNAATPTTLTFTHETWEYFHNEIDKKYKDKKIVGWIHTHPNFGIFLSENDKFIHQNFFNDANQVAYVVDPIQNEEGFYFWIDKKLERCPGFFMFDKVGAKIKQRDFEKETEERSGVTAKPSKATPVLAVMIVILAIAFIFTTLSQMKRIDELEVKVENQQKFIESFTSGASIIQIPADEMPDVFTVPENKSTSPDKIQTPDDSENKKDTTEPPRPESQTEKTDSANSGAAGK